METFAARPETTKIVRDSMKVIELTDWGKSREHFALYEALWAEDNAKRRLQEAADALIRRIERVKRYLAQGARLNELGELQGQAPEFDILCAAYEQAKKHTDIIAKLAGFEFVKEEAE